MVSKVVVQELTTREQGKAKNKVLEVMFRRVEPPDYKERKEYRGLPWMGFTDKSRKSSMIEQRVMVPMVKPL